MYHSLTKCFWILIAIALVCTVQTQVRAQDQLEPEKEASSAIRDDWSLSITPYAWLASQSTDVGGAKLRQSFDDLASVTNLGFQGRLLVRWRWLNFAADWTYADMTSNTEIGRTRVDMDLKQNILDMKLGVFVYDSTTPKQDGGIAVWAGAGARYWDNQVDFTITTQPILPSGSVTVVTEKTGQTWWDPVLGLGLHFPVTPKVGFQILATGGGFGIGDASDYIWDAEFAALFRLSRRFTINAGYRHFKYDRTDGSGDEEVRQTVTVSGPFIGLKIDIL
jgi:hypothetical protein